MSRDRWGIFLGGWGGVFFWGGGGWGGVGALFDNAQLESL